MSKIRAAAPLLASEEFERQWWRVLALFRWVSLLYAVLVFGRTIEDYARPGGAMLVLAGMTVWTAAAGRLYRDPLRRRWPLLCVDLAVTLAVILSAGYLQDPVVVAGGAQTLPVMWVAAPVMAWALAYGWWAALPASALVAAANVAVRGQVTAPLLHNLVLLLLTGCLVGHVAALGRQAERQLARAMAVQAAAAERDRLARAVHDGALQVLGLMARQGRAFDPELAGLAADQEAALRALVAGSYPAHPGPGEAAGPGSGRQHVDAGAALGALAGGNVSVSGPLDPVLLPAPASTELVAAVRAALDNVARHAGPRVHAHVLVEDLDEHVEVTVRDDGAGFAEGRLAEARAEGRLGVAQCIVGRVSELGGTAVYDSTPGAGVRVVLQVPRSGVRA